MKQHHPLIKLAASILIGFFTVLPVTSDASDLTGGYAWTPNDRVTSTKLNNSVGGATINTTFYTDKTVAQPVTADTFLFYSAASSVYKKTTLATLLLGNTNLIVGQTIDYTPSTNDYLLTWSAANNAFRRVNFLSLQTNRDLILSQARSTNAPIAGTLFLGASNSTYYTWALTNLFQEWWRWMPFSTNTAGNQPWLSLHTAPTNNDLLLIWDSVNSTNKATSLIGLMTNLPAVAANKVTNTDFVPIISTATNANNLYGTNSTLSRISVTNFFRTFTSTNYPLNSSAWISNTHGFPGPATFIRAALVCTNSDLGYAVGDEVFINPNGVTYGSDATQIWFSSTLSGGFSISRKTNSTVSALTPGSWNFKVTAMYTFF